MSRVISVIRAGFASTDDSFRTWGSSISDMITASGCNKTSDTGQIDWVTVLKPVTTNTIAGYEIRKITNSTLGDLYVRIDYKTLGASNGNNATLQVTVGTGTDGAGAITEIIFPEINCLGANSITLRNDTTPYPSYCYYDSGTLLISLCPNKSDPYYSDLLVITRTNDADGAYNGKALMQITESGSTYTNIKFSYWSSSFGLVKNSLHVPSNLCYPYAASVPSIEYDGKGAVCVIEHMTPELNWHKGIVVLNAADASLGAVVSADVFGASHSYLSLGTSYKGVEASANNSPTTVATGALAFLWDES